MCSSPLAPAGCVLFRPARTRQTAAPARGALRGLLTIPDAFYEPWTDEEMGE